MEFRAAGRSETGRVRSVNQDRFWADERRGIFVVADGVGGKEASERASAAVVRSVADRAERLHELLESGDPRANREQRSRVTECLSRLVSEINSEIYEAAQGTMSTTCELLVLSAGAGFVAHVGDSRTYLIRGEVAYQLTEDHTFAAKLRREGREEEAPGRDGNEYEHVLTRSLGGAPEVDVDTLFVDVQQGDQFVMCTDGVSDVLEPERLTGSSFDGNMNAYAERVVDEALEAGSSDNATAVVVRAGGDDSSHFSEGAAVDTVRKISFLEQIDLFDGLDKRDLLKVLRIVFQETARDGETVIERSEEADDMYMLLEGEISLQIEGNEVARLSPGTHFGEMALFASEPRSADAVAQGEVVLLVVPGDQFRRLVHVEDVELGNKLLRNLLERAAQRVRETTLELMEERSDPAEQADVLGKARTLELDAISEEDRPESDSEE